MAKASTCKLKKVNTKYLTKIKLIFAKINYFTYKQWNKYI